MVVPPPNVTGNLHLGHALTSSLEDVFIRWQRMLGNETLWVPGSDHAGIATQMVVERFIENKYNSSRIQLGRKKFEEAVWIWKEAKGDQIMKQFRRLGSSLDWDHSTFTLNPDYSYAVNEAFIRLHDEGLIYRDEKLINWCCHLGTSVSDLEVNRVEPESSIEIPGYDLKVPTGTMHNFAYKLVEPVGDIDEIIVSTTRLETMPGDTAVAVNPHDPRYSNLIGQMVKHPLFDHKLIPIVADNAVDMDKGTGALKVTPAHSFVDFEIGKRHNLPQVSCINKKGYLETTGLVDELFNTALPNQRWKIKDSIHRFDARQLVLDYLHHVGLYRGNTDHQSSLRICSRSGDVIEPIIAKQWFVSVNEMASDALQAVNDGRIKFVQEEYAKQWQHWLTTTGDWCISRSLWWGHQIPVYQCKDGTTGREQWVSAHSEKSALEKFGGSPDDITITQDTDVLDTWFSSALFPFAALGWPKETPDLKKFYPLNLMETGHDLIFFWVARMVMMGMKLTGEVLYVAVFPEDLLKYQKHDKFIKEQHDFWKEIFASVYVEYCKSCFTPVRNEEGKGVGYQATNDQQIAIAVNILRVAETALRLFSPFAPFLTEELWQRLPKQYLDREFPESITVATYPTLDEFSQHRDHKIVDEFDFILSVYSELAFDFRISNVEAS
ncbi:valine--tRNA ligase [Ciona intestinalis]